MHRLLLFFIIIISCNQYVVGQHTIEIYLDNPAPRAGDQVTLSINATFMVDYLKSQTDNNIEFIQSVLPDSYIKKEVQFNEPGDFLVGPYKFEFQGENYVSDSIKVYVEEGLPFEEGVWLRHVISNEAHYVIVEQLVANESDMQHTPDGFSYTVGGVAKKEFAEIEEDAFKNVEVKFNSSMSNTRREEGADLFASGLSYSFIA